MDAWGKYQDADRFHRLEHHCADVAACFEALLADPVLRARFVLASGHAGFTSTTAARLAVLAFLHDFGKLNSGFQFKVLDRSRLAGVPRACGHIGMALLAPDGICAAAGLFDHYRAWGPAVDPLLLAALAHHGRPAKRPMVTGRGPRVWDPVAGYDPPATARLLGERSRLWFPEAFVDGSPLPDTPELAHLFAGTVALADQIGSDEEFFGPEPVADAGYIDRSRRAAEDAVRRKGFRRSEWPARSAPVSIRTMFGHEHPRPVQVAAAEAPLDHPLLIVESETGSGKTEAAILRFAALWKAGIVDGLYFAVPTRAAAKQLHTRVSRALARLFPGDQRAETVLAVPGYLRVGDTAGRRTGRFEVFWEDDPDEEVRLARWSAESARKYLSATAAVGTIDQALLAGLKIKWAHFRAAALSRSLLVVDEVHASDPYMTEILRAVLHGHLHLGGHALLMSATLGTVARTRIATRKARAGHIRPTEARAVPYPALTLVSRGGDAQIRAIAATHSQTKEVVVRLDPVLGAPAGIAGIALDAAGKGAKVLVIRNTVASAQEVFDAVLAGGGEELSFRVEGTAALHHSRFAAEDRRLLDAGVEATLGKSRPRGGVVTVGTQTLEQSLDIDADLLITDICPVDVLLQRIGRLHRHARTDRPAGFQRARCVVVVPDSGLESGLGGGLLSHGLGISNRGSVYRNLLGIEATRRLITDHPVWTIPEMNRHLVECATHPDLLTDLANELGGPWLDHEQQTFGLPAAEKGVAREHAFTRTEPFDERFVFPDPDENIRTRLGEDGPRITLPEPVPGPFGRRVQTFNLPAHMFRGSLPGRDEIEGAHAEVMPDGLTLRIGDYRFRYDRTGVRHG